LWTELGYVIISWEIYLRFVNIPMTADSTTTAASKVSQFSMEFDP